MAGIIIHQRLLISEEGGIFCPVCDHQFQSNLRGCRPETIRKHGLPVSNLTTSEIEADRMERSQKFLRAYKTKYGHLEEAA